jgi:hypothetical protein
MKNKSAIIGIIMTIIGAVIGFFLAPALTETIPPQEIVDIATAPVDSSAILEKDIIIADYFKTITALDSARDEQAEIASKAETKLRMAHDSLEARNLELERLTLINAELRIQSEAASAPPNVSQEGDVTFVIPFEDTAGWWAATVMYNPEKDNGYLDLTARDEYTITEWEEGGRWKVQVDNANPYVKIKEGTNVFVLDAWKVQAEQKCNLWKLLKGIFSKKKEK